MCCSYAEQIGFIHVRTLSIYKMAWTGVNRLYGSLVLVQPDEVYVVYCWKKRRGVCVCIHSLPISLRQFRFDVRSDLEGRKYTIWKTFNNSRMK